jgi:outer membrane protein TolC
VAATTAFAVWMASVVIAGAQPVATTERLSLEQAIARAFLTSHRLAEVRAREAGAHAALRGRQAAEKPTSTASASYTRTNHVTPFGFLQPNGSRFEIYPDIPDNLVTRLSMQWPIYTSGRTDALERAALAEASAVGADLDVARADLKLEVTRVYWALATSIETVRVLEASLQRADAQLTDARQRLAVGLIPPSDVFSFEAQRSREQLQLIEEQNRRESMLIELQRLTGASPELALVPADPLDGPSVLAPPAQPGAGPTALVKEALSQRPERKALTFRIGGAEERERAVATGTKPTIGFTGGLDYANPNSKIFPRQDAWQATWDLSVGVSWPVFDGGRTKADVAEAAAAATAARERLAELDTLLAAEVRQRLLDMDSSRAAVQTALEAVRSATEARRVLGDRFAVGVATTTDVLVAQEALLAAELSRARALASVRLSEARLVRALGRP